MKGVKNALIAITFFLAGFSSTAQTKGSFMRVFDNKGSKINEGYLCALTDSSFILQKGKDSIEVFATKIAKLKLRRSFGHTVGVSTGITATFFSLLVATGGEKEPSGWFSYTPSEGAVIGLVIGAVAGAATGSIIAAIRKRAVIIIDNNLEKWKPAKELLLKHLPRPETPTVQNGPVEILH